jgi:YHS domain-containing protein
MKKLFLTALAFTGFGIAVLPAQTALANSDEIYTSWRNNLGAGGWDVVSYYQGSPVKGDQDNAAKWKGANWVFASQSNLNLFLAEPEKYAPAYGGYCAWAVANDKLAKGNPEYWHIEDGRLYFNYNKKIAERWLNDVEGFISRANANWPDVLE